MRDDLFIKKSAAASKFEQLYIGLRTKEKRMHTDVQVRLLPAVEREHPYYSEWECRRKSMERFLNYLRKKNKPLKILEVGCGNGWLSAKIAETVNAQVTGIDVNATELNQAIRVFDKQNLKFFAIDIDNIAERDFDIILFAASIQYFAFPGEVLTSALKLLKKDGEIHIMDTRFYKASEVNAAMQRSKLYYSSLGFEEMCAYYFHHSLNDLKEFDYKMLFNPRGFINKLRGSKMAFCWICIKNKADDKNTF